MGVTVIREIKTNCFSGLYSDSCILKEAELSGLGGRVGSRAGGFVSIDLEAARRHGR